MSDVSGTKSRKPKAGGGRLRVKKKSKAKSRTPEFRDSAPIVPPSTVAGNALAFVIAIMSFLACLTVGAVTMVRDAAHDWQNDIAREVTIQIRPIDGVDIVQQIDKTVILTQSFPGVGTVRALSDTETRKLLEPWLGTGLDLDALPVPRLVQVELEDPVNVDLNALRLQIERELTGATLDDHSAWTRRLTSMARTMAIGGLVILALVMTAMILSVVFATRAAMAGNRGVIEVLNLVGAEDSFIAREFQRHFLLLGLKGGVAGGVAAIVSFALFALFGRQSGATAAFDQLHALFGDVGIGAAGYIAAIAIVFLVAVLTAATSRIAVRRTLSQME